MNQATKDAFVSKLLTDLENDRLVLPTLPEVALKVRDTLEDENASLKQVAEVIGVSLTTANYRLNEGLGILARRLRRAGVG